MIRCRESAHLWRVTLGNNEEEVAIMKHDTGNGDIWYIRIMDLDIVDRERLIDILRKRDADKYPLWELMSMKTLKNGMNALEFFHQFVKIRTEDGQILSVNSGKRGKTKPRTLPAANNTVTEERKAGRPANK